MSLELADGRTDVHRQRRAQNELRGSSNVSCFASIVSCLLRHAVWLDTLGKDVHELASGEGGDKGGDDVMTSLFALHCIPKASSFSCSFIVMMCLRFVP
jgi:hypothetical protein